MYRLTTQFSERSAEGFSYELEWNSIEVDTLEEAKGWWKCRLAAPTSKRRVLTMYNENNELIEVKFL